MGRGRSHRRRAQTPAGQDLDKKPSERVADDRGLLVELVDDRLLVGGDVTHTLAGEHLGVIVSVGDRGGVIQPPGRHRRVASVLEERGPPVPAAVQQPEPVHEYDGVLPDLFARATTSSSSCWVGRGATLFICIRPRSHLRAERIPDQRPPPPAGNVRAVAQARLRGGPDRPANRWDPPFLPTLARPRRPDGRRVGGAAIWRPLPLKDETRRVRQTGPSA
jgi:hypothetical protein